MFLFLVLETRPRRQRGSFENNWRVVFHVQFRISSIFTTFEKNFDTAFDPSQRLSSAVEQRIFKDYMRAQIGGKL